MCLESPPLLLVALDGLGANFVSPELTPQIWNLAHQGCWSPSGMACQYPSQTSPNFRSIVTGQCVDKHGILDNVMQDVERDAWFDPFSLFIPNGDGAQKINDDYKNPCWYAHGNLPIWTQLKRQLPGTSSGSVYFPFTDVKDQQTDYLYHDYQDLARMKDNGHFTEKIDVLVSWFKHSSKPIKFGLLYIPEPDKSFHLENPHGLEGKRVLRQADELVGHCIEQLKKCGLWGNINVIFLADHGHTPVRNPEDHVDLLSDHDDSLDLINKLTLVTNHPVGIIAQKERILDWDFLETYFKEYAKGKPVRVYRKSEFPKKHRYANNPRVGEILIVPEYKKVALMSLQTMDMYCSKNPIYGEHGYEPDWPEMRPFFVALGPSFKERFQSNGNFQNIDLYPLMCKLLGCTPEPCDGNLAAVTHLLRSGAESKL